MTKLFCLGILLSACTTRDLSVEQLNEYVRDSDNEISLSKSINGYDVTVTYRPRDLLVYQELNGNTDLALIDSLRKKYNPNYYFILSLSKNNREALHTMEGGMSQYSELVQTLSFRMHDYVTLTTTKADTIPVSDFILNRTYGMGSSTDLLFAFNKERAKEQDWVQFNLNEFGLGIGNQRFRFKKNSLDRVPSLRFNSIN